MIGYDQLAVLLGKLLTVTMWALVIFQIKHYFCDYPWQTPYMLQKFKGGFEWIMPLASHAAVHAYCTMIICAFFLLAPIEKGLTPGWYVFALAGFDFIVHFIVDRIKASPKLAGRYKSLSASEYASVMRMSEYKDDDHPELVCARDLARRKLKDNQKFWLWLGRDQAAHHLTHYVIIFVIMSQFIKLIISLNP